MNKDFISVSPSSGQEDDIVDVTPEVNPNLGTRTTSLNVKTSGGNSRAISIQQYGVPFLGSIGLSVQDSVMQVEFDMRFKPEGITVKEDEARNEYIAQYVQWKLPNISSYSDTMFKLSANLAVMTKLLQEWERDYGQYTIKARLNAGNIEAVRLLTMGSSGGYQAFANSLNTSIGDGGNTPRYLNFDIEFQDQAGNRTLFGYIFRPAT